MLSGSCATGSDFHQYQTLDGTPYKLNAVNVSFGKLEQGIVQHYELNALAWAITQGTPTSHRSFRQRFSWCMTTIEYSYPDWFLCDCISKSVSVLYWSSGTWATWYFKEPLIMLWTQNKHSSGHRAIQSFLQNTWLFSLSWPRLQQFGVKVSLVSFKWCIAIW